MKSRFIYIVLATVFASCSTDFLDVTELGTYNNKLVVNGVLESGEQVRIQLSNSTSTTDTELPQVLPDADVTIIQNGNVRSAVYEASSKTYVAQIVPQAGDLINLDIKHDGYVPINSSVTIPASIQAVSTLTPNGGVDTSGTPSDLLSIQFVDDASQSNYYKINFYYFNTSIAEFIPMAFALNDPDFTEYNTIMLNDASMLFTDELFNGDTKTLSTVAPFGLTSSNPGDKYLIVLESITEDLYRYYNTLQKARDSREITFSNPFNNAVVIHSNINRGLGILGGSYVAKDTLR